MTYIQTTQITYTLADGDTWELPANDWTITQGAASDALTSLRGRRKAQGHKVIDVPGGISWTAPRIDMEDITSETITVTYREVA